MRSKVSVLPGKSKQCWRKKKIAEEMQLYQMHPWEESGCLILLLLLEKPLIIFLNTIQNATSGNRQLLQKTAVLARVSPDGKAH